MKTEDYHGIWVFAELKAKNIKNVTFELLGEAQKLGQKLHTSVSAVLLGHDIESKAKELIAFGADYVYLINDYSLKDYNDELYSDVFSQMIEKYKPEIILFGATVYGRSLAPRLASRFNTGLTADCTRLEIDKESKNLLQTRPAFGGGLMATIVCSKCRPQMSTVRPDVMEKMQRNTDSTGEIIKPSVKIMNPVTRILEINDIYQDNNLHEAEIIVSVGRGIGSKKDIVLIKELADAIGGTVGATRAIVDAGWIGYNHQIGQTGITVAPKVYLACGISGAVQHLAGMISAEKIIAINKDSDAPIFKVAHYGIVGNLTEILPVLIDKIKKGQNIMKEGCV